MISPKNLENLLSLSGFAKTTSDFIKQHRYVEGYLKRILLIALRLKEVQYDNSKKIIEITYIKTHELLFKILFMLHKSLKTNEKIKNQEKYRKYLNEKHPDFKIISDLFFNFTAKYRNLIVHGIIDEIKDERLLEILLIVNKEFVFMLENLLKKEFGHSAFETPGDWGAKRGKKENIENTIKKLKLGKINSLPLNINKVIEKLKSMNRI